jgi:uncharacterized protein YjiS (DUF1127 family)
MHLTVAAKQICISRYKTQTDGEQITMSALSDGTYHDNQSSRIGPVQFAAKIGEILKACALAVARWYLTRRTIHTVAQLDDRMLKDMGIDRSEIERVVTCGRATNTVMWDLAISRREDRNCRDAIAGMRMSARPHTKRAA